MNDSNDSFKQASVQRKKGSGSVVVPFISGLLGASLVLGVCFGVPEVKNKLLPTATTNVETSTSSSNVSSDLIDLVEYSNTSVTVAQKVLPSIVGIKIKYSINSIFGSSEAEATGSGIIISEDGYILTNNHVVSSESSSYYYTVEEATKMTVNLYNETKEYEATIIGTDEYTDLAVIKIDASGLTPATLGDSDNVKVGEFAMAIGCPLGLDITVTSGIISAVNRTVSEGTGGTEYTCIQTDAAINSGNSGGALVNSNGEVIGINTLKLSGTGVEGMGFAIPISSTTDIIDQLIEYKTVKRPYIGISGVAVDEKTAKNYNIPTGVYVYSAEKDSPAEKAGLQKGDVITHIEGTEVKNVNELNKVKNKSKIGDTVTLKIYRNGEEKEVQVILAETPSAEEQKQSSTTQEIEDSLFNRNQQNKEDSSSIFDLFR